MADERHKDVNWTLQSGPSVSWDCAQLAVLMDIRDELKRINRTLDCPNFQAIPRTLARISRKLPVPKKRKSRSVNV